jgi:septal ring factor EnvC (AmiA/AmiB activator)
MLYFLETALKKLIAPLLATLLVIVPVTRTGWCRTTGMATITATALNVRGAPDRKAKRVAVLDKGTLVTIHDTVDGWLKISCRDVNGYIINDERYVHLEEPDAQIRQLKEKAEQIERKIESHKSDLKEFTTKESEIIENLNEIELSRNELNRQADDLRERVEQIRGTIAENRQAATVLEQKIKETGAYANKRLVALYKLNLMGRMNVIGSADSVYAVLRAKKDMAIILNHDAEILSGHLQNQERLKAITDRLDAEEKEKAALEKTMQQRIDAMGRETDKRQAILKDIREKESARKAALASLEKAAGALDRTIADLFKKAESRRWLKGSFSLLKGLLPMPVRGKIITEFGKYRDEDLKIVNFRSGIDIQAERGEPVRAVFRGEVLFAQWFKGYGNMLIIDHGEKYYTVYAHAQELFKKQGDFVETNEVVATVGNTASLSNVTSLYFELRHQGKPIDPLTWLKTG